MLNLQKIKDLTTKYKKIVKEQSLYLWNNPNDKKSKAKFFIEKHIKLSAMDGFNSFIYDFYDFNTNTTVQEIAEYLINYFKEFNPIIGSRVNIRGENNQYEEYISTIIRFTWE